MTVADEPQAREAGVPVRAWRAFGRWRRSRPFWGGFVILLAGLEYYFSVHLKPTDITVSFGPQGFLAWLIPLVLVMCALLVWFTPAQRIFYGIVAAATSVYGLIGLNFGGFFVGMLLGMVGGALAASWAATAPAGPAPVDADADSDPDTLDGPDEPRHAGEAQTEFIPVYTDEEYQRRSGPLTDELPDSPHSPLADAADSDGDRRGRHALASESKPTGLARLSRLRPTRGRGAALILVPLTVVTVGLLGIQHSAPAYAAVTCPSTKSTAPATGGGATGKAKPSTTPTATPSATPSATATKGSGLLGGILSGIVDGVKGLVGADGDDARRRRRPARPARPRPRRSRAPRQASPPRRPPAPPVAPPRPTPRSSRQTPGSRPCPPPRPSSRPGSWTCRP